MKAAPGPRTESAACRVLTIDREAANVALGTFAELSLVPRKGDVWVVNDAATLPASLAGYLGDTPIEVRLAGWVGAASFRAILFGEGSWREDTDQRLSPPPVGEGDRIAITAELSATVTRVHSEWTQLLELTFEPADDRFWAQLYEAGKPIQYRYLEREFPLSSFQTPLASRPWAVEPPSAGFHFTASAIERVRKRGAIVATLTHGAGLSATGNPDLDRLLPFPERYEIPLETAVAVGLARANGGPYRGRRH